VALIGSLVVKILANMKGFEGQLTGAQKELKKFGDMAARPISLFGKLASFPGQGLQSFLQPLQSALAGIPLVGSTLSQLAGSGGFVAMFKDTTSHILANKKQADSLGLSYAELVGMQYLAGDASESVSKAMFKLNAKMGELKSGNKTVGDSFAKLGLDGEKLAGMSSADRLGAIGDYLRSIPDPAERAAVGFELMGKHGFALMPFLLRGSEALKEWKDKAILKGLVPSDAEIQKLRETALALKEFDMTMEGVKQKAVTGVGLPIATAGRFLMEHPKNIGYMVMPWKWGEYDKNLAEFTNKQKVAAKTEIKNEDVLKDAKAKFEHAESIRKVSESLETELATMGKSHAEIKRGELIKLGATQADLARFDALVKNVEAEKQAAESIKQIAEAQRKRQEEGSRVYQDNLTPLEKMSSEVERLGGLLTDGAISWETYARGVGKVTDEFLKLNEPELPKLLAGGSAAAVSAVNKASRSQPSGTDAIDKLRKAVEKQAESDKRREQYLQIIAASVPNIVPVERKPIG
jgi:hypothetical protein